MFKFGSYEINSLVVVQYLPHDPHALLLMLYNLVSFFSFFSYIFFYFLPSLIFFWPDRPIYCSEQYVSKKKKEWEKEWGSKFFSLLHPCLAYISWPKTIWIWVSGNRFFILFPGFQRFRPLNDYFSLAWPQKMLSNPMENHQWRQINCCGLNRLLNWSKLCGD